MIGSTNIDFKPPQNVEGLAADSAELKEMVELFMKLPQFDREVLLSSAKTLLQSRALDQRH